MKTINKKAFTIVELVIVISIIGILAAVLIPTFGNLIEKANEANDTSFVKNINTMLIVGEVESGKPDTFTEMKNVLAENGINIEKIKDTNTKDYKYAWNYSTNRMILMDDKFNIVEPSGDKGEITNKYDYYVIVKSEEEMNKYDGFGYYLLDGFTKTSDVLQVKSGLDTGNNEGLSVKVASNDAFTAFVNTNKGVKLVIDAENATINHFGTVTELEIIKVAQASYHEYGLVDFATISAGRIEVMKDGKVSGLKATGTSKVDMQDGAVIGAIEAEGTVALNDKAEANKLGKNEVELSRKMTKKNGGFFRGFGTSNSPYIISSEEEWIELVDCNGYTSYKWYDEVKYTTFVGAIQGYWKVTCDLDFTNYNGKKVGLSILYGTIDFDGHTVRGVYRNMTNIASGFGGGLIQNNYGTIKNLNFENMSDETGYSTLTCYSSNTLNSTSVIENVTTYGNITTSDSNAAPFAYSVTNAQFINCTNKTNIVAQSGLVSAFVGQITSGAQFINCVNYGTIINSGKVQGGLCPASSMILANYSTSVNAKINIENCKNYGTILSTVEGAANLVTFGYSAEADIKNDTSEDGQKGVCASVGKLEELTLTNGNYNFNASENVDSYKLSFSFTYKYDVKGHGTTAYVTDITPSDEVKAYEWINYEEGMKLTEVKVGDLTLQTTVKEGVTYYVFNMMYLNSRCTTDWINVQYTAYDANGIPVAIYTTTVNCK